VIAQTITCDVCGKQKGQVNHWWMYLGGEMFSVWAWNDDAGEVSHACGQECLHKALDKWIQEKVSETHTPKA